MQWLQITIEAPDKNVDRVSAHLEALGITDLVIEDEADFHAFLRENQKYWDYVDEALESAMAGKSRVIFYLENTPVGRAQLDSLQKALPWPLIVNPIQEEDWANNWKQYFKPLPVGKRLLIVPQWEQSVDFSDKVPLILDPGLIFGTGAHPTTKRALELAEGFTRPGHTVLDLGAGSGILSIAALLMGASHATACDIDPKAPDIISANAALNGFGAAEITPLWGDVLAEGPLRQRLGETTYDVIFANIVADVIIDLASFTAPWLVPGGHFICSGILDGREPAVEAALRSGGFSIVQRHQDGDWHSFLATVSS